MTDVLEQSEVDALLAGGAPTAPERQTPSPLSPDQVRTLTELHQDFARQFAQAVSAELRTPLEVSRPDIEQLLYGQFIRSLPNPTCLNVMQTDTLGGPICLQISPFILYPILDRLLGGTSEGQFIPQRPLTQIEQGLAQRLVERAAQNLAQAWRDWMPVTFTAGEYFSDPQTMRLVPDEQTVAVVSFELKMGAHCGTLSLCIPCSGIEMMAATSIPAATGPAEANMVQMQAVLAQTTLRLSELRGLQPGDIITTESPADRPVTIRADGKDFFLGEPAQFHGNRSVRLTSRLGEES